MRIGRLRNALRLALSGLPRLWRAARGAGAGRREALDVVLASVLAFVLAARRAPAQWRRQNAVRHFVWQAYLTARHGRDLAVAVAGAQESGSADPVDSAVDERNNLLGQQHGLTDAGALRSLDRRDALRRLAAEAEARWAVGGLAASPPRER